MVPRAPQDALVDYGKQFDGMSEYEAYFSFVWTHYRERVEPAYVPWLLRQPALCNSNNRTLMAEFQKFSILNYLTCHDNYEEIDYYINCNSRMAQCDPSNRVPVSP